MKGLIILLISLLVFMVSCATPAPAPAPAPKPTPQVEGIFIEGTSGGDAETLNWLLAADATSFSYAGQTLDSLATYDNDWNVVLRHLAKPVEVSEDGLTYTITIRDDLRWSDGTRVTAEDYLYSEEPHVLRLAQLYLPD